MTLTSVPVGIRTAAQERLPWGVFLLVAGAFLIMEHDYEGPKKFQMLVGATSLSEFQNLEQQLFQPRPWRQAGGILLGVFGLVSILRGRRGANNEMGFLGGLLLLFAAWAAMSLFWADDAGLTFRRLVLFMFIILGALGAALSLTQRQFLWLTVMWTGAYLAVALGDEIIQGTFQPFSAGYRFAGTIHPNAQAINCAILFLAVLQLHRDAQRRKGALVLLLLISFLFLYLTRSRTAFTSVVAVMIVQWGIIQSRSAKVAIASAVLVLVIASLLLSSVVWPVAQRGLTMGREDASETTGTLTGRRQLWEQCLEFSAERPWLGYGYGGFWNPERSTEVINQQGWPISHAHNAYLDILLELGPVALLVYVLILLTGITLAISYYRATGEPVYAFFSMVLLFCALNGLLESVAIQRGQVFFIAVAILIYLGFHQERAGVPEPLISPVQTSGMMRSAPNKESTA